MINNYSKTDEIKNLLNSRGWSPQKRLGQNYLIDKGSREFIWKILDAQDSEKIWEIGPGLGALTHKLAERNKPFWVFELDEGYSSFLVERFSTQGLILIKGDFLKTWQEVYKKSPPNKILGNLPYNISSQIILNLIERESNLPYCLFTIQKELAQRLSANINQKDYSAFSVLTQWAFDVKVEKTLAPSCFYPRPQVSSAVVSLRPHKKYPISSFLFFKDLVKSAFSSRRKMLKNNLQLLCQSYKLEWKAIESSFDILGLSLKQRAEELSPQTFVQLASLLSQKK